MAVPAFYALHALAASVNGRSTDHAECRSGRPDATVVLLLLGGPSDAAQAAGADTVVDAADGMAALAAAVRAVAL